MKCWQCKVFHSNWTKIKFCPECGAETVVCADGSLFIHYKKPEEFGKQPGKCPMSGKKVNK